MSSTCHIHAPKFRLNVVMRWKNKNPDVTHHKAMTKTLTKQDIQASQAL